MTVLMLCRRRILLAIFILALLSALWWLVKAPSFSVHQNGTGNYLVRIKFFLSLNQHDFAANHSFHSSQGSLRARYFGLDKNTVEFVIPKDFPEKEVIHFS